MRPPGPGKPIARTVFRGGADGVASTHSGYISPRWSTGNPDHGTETGIGPEGRILTPADEALYIYKVVGLASPDQEQFGLAGRRGGFATIPLGRRRSRESGKKLRPAGVDFVDVAALDVNGFPSP